MLHLVDFSLCQLDTCIYEGQSKITESWLIYFYWVVSFG